MQHGKSKKQILFIDARNLGYLINRKTLEFTDDDVAQVATTYHNWRNGENEYNDIQGFCKSTTVEEVAALNYVVTPGRFVGLPRDEDDSNFEERFNTLKQNWKNRLLKRMI